ncbi:MAG: hypothetical protein U1F61_09950 [Opitutaceae bacterium]
MPPLRWITLSHGPEAVSAVVRLALLARDGAEGQVPSLVETRRLAGGRSFLAAVVDLEGRALEWLELGVQSPQDLADSPAARCGLLSNALLDREWTRVVDSLVRLNPDAVLSAGSFASDGQFWVVDFDRGITVPLRAPGGGSAFVICRDETRLREAKRAPYATSFERWFVAEAASAPPVWVSAAELEDLTTLPATVAAPDAGKGPFFPLNPSGGPLLIRRLPPLSLDGFARWLRSRGTRDPAAPATDAVPADADPLARLEFGLLAVPTPPTSPVAKYFEAQAPLESFYLRIELWKSVVEEALRVSRLSDRPFFDLAPDSFRVAPGSPSPLIPAGWTFSVDLVRPGVAAPFELPGFGTCFVPCGNGVGSPLFERFGGWMEGSGTVRISQATDAGDGQTRLEGSIEGQGLRSTGNSQRIVWVQIPMDRQSLTFMASLETEQGAARAGVRFRALVKDVPAAILTQLKSAAAPRRTCQYHVLRPVDPALDIHALGLIGMRILLANDPAVLPELEDDVFELAALIPDDCSVDQIALLAESPEVGERAKRLLSAKEWNPGADDTTIPRELWYATVRELAEFVGVDEQETLPPTHADDGTALWVQPLAARSLALHRLALHVRGLLSAPRPAHEEIARAVHRFVRSQS